MIEDLEMRELFRIESGEHLQLLEEGLLRLEKAPQDAAIIEELFREAHSLKGASRMLALEQIETVAHRFEDLLGEARSGKRKLTQQAINVMYRCLDSMAKLAEEAISGEKSGIVVAEILSALELKAAEDGGQVLHEERPAPGSKEQPAGDEAVSSCAEAEGTTPEAIPETAPEKPPQTAHQAAHQTAPDAAPGATAAATASPPSLRTPYSARPDSFLIETIRVETRKLDRLMTQAGELTVAKLRVARRCADMEELADAWDRIASSLRSKARRDTELEQWGVEFSALLDRVKRSASDDNSRLEAVTGAIEETILEVRLLPLSTIFNTLPRMVRDISLEQGKSVQVVIEGGETSADKRVLEEMKAPLMHIVRNAVDHGIESPEVRERLGKPQTGTISIRAYRTAENIVVEVQDDGRGLDLEAVRHAARKSGRREEELAAMSEEQLGGLIFASGLSTSPFISDISGRGVGLDVVRTNVERLKGGVTVDSAPGAGCAMKITLPLTLATGRVLIVAAKGVSYALPVEYVRKSYQLGLGAIFSMDGRDAVHFEGQTVAVTRLSDLLSFARTDFLSDPDGTASGEERGGEAKSPCLIINSGGGRVFALLVDELLDEQEIVLKPQTSLIRHILGIGGATILGSGEVCMILHPPELGAALRKEGTGLAQTTAAAAAPERKKSVLVAEDSLTTRTQMKRILEGFGYDVATAVDGLDALAKLGSGSFDALVSDITMPNMDGLSLTQKVRQNRKYSELPIVLVTMLASDEDKRRGMEAGANAYITKPAFDQKLLMETMRRLI